MTTRSHKDASQPTPTPGEAAADVVVLPPQQGVDALESLALPASPGDALQPPPDPSTRASTKPVIKEIGQDISESLPAGIELHRLYRYQLPSLKTRAT